MGFGVRPGDVDQVIIEDNMEREAQHLKNNTPPQQLRIEVPNQPNLQDMQDDPIYGSELDRFFGPCSEDELDDDVEEGDQDHYFCFHFFRC